MRRSRWFRVVVLLVLVASTLTLVGAGPPPSRPTPVVVSILGVAQVQGRDVLVEVIVVVPRGADPNEVALAALREQGGRPFESDEFTITGLVWDQFSDGNTGNDFVTQCYNAEDDPTSGGGEAALTDSHVTWTGVTTSQFAFKYGDTTNRCPSLVRECPDRQAFDTFNDVAWLELRPNILGVTWFSTSTDEADMALSTRYSWSTDGSSGYDVETVFLHENGHVVGLGHSEVAAAVMYPYYQGVRRDLHPDDIEGITFLYPPAGNQAPVADAGPDQSVNTGSMVQLDGSASSDPDGDSITYSWAFVSKPTDSTASLNDETSDMPTFVADLDGTYEVQLTVSDGELSSTDRVVVTAATAAEPTTVSVASITYAAEGGRGGNKHLSVTIALVDDAGNPVSGASVSIDLYRDESFYAAATGTTGTEGTVTFKLPNAPSGWYTTDVTGVTAAGLTWDGLTPTNEFEKK